MPTRISATTQSDPGRIRERNEDSALAFIPAPPNNDLALLVVADGMGGYRAGDQASALAVRTIREVIEPVFAPSSSSQPTVKLGGQPTVKLKGRQETDGERTTVELPETADSDYYGQLITRAVRHANDVIVSYGQDHREARGLGSTVTMALIIRSRAYFANIGDSRSYLFRDGELRSITRDHSLVARLVEAGEIDQEDIYTHPKRNLIYRSLGADRGDIEVDLFEEELRAGDVLLLCSDGLWEKVRAPDIIALLQGDTDLAAITAQLIAEANANGGEDNITIVLARVEAADDAVTEPASEDITEVDTGEIATVTPDA